MSTGIQLVSELIAASIVASKQAADIIRNVKKSGELGVKEKSEKTDFVTIADIEAQKCIVEHLKTNFPNVKYRGEEGNLEKFSNNIEASYDFEALKIMNENFIDIKNKRPLYEKITQDELFVWIDPLDGTREYVESDDTFLEEVTVLIGIAYKGRPIAGVINQPFYHRLKNNDHRDGILWAFVGLGVYHNRIKSDELNQRYVKFEYKDNGNHSNRIVTSRNHATEIIIKNLSKIPNAEILFRGGCGFKILVLIDGNADCYLYPSRGLKRWDSCAPEAVVRALNGECTDVFNDRYDYSNIDANSYENLLGFVAAFSNHNFYIKNLTTDIIGHVWQESLKPKREKKNKK